MSESQTEYETDAEPTAFASAPWEPEGPDQNGHAHVWGSDGDLVATVCDNPVYGETAFDRARLIAAAGTAAQEAREMGYDPAKTVGQTDELLRHLEELVSCLEEAHEKAHPEGHMQGRRYDLAVDGAKNTLDALASAEGSKNER